MKTILEWYEELPDGIRERAIANATIHSCRRASRDRVPLLHTAITRGMEWCNTPEENPQHELYIEGFHWLKIYEEAESMGFVAYQERAKLSKHKAVRTPMFLGLKI